MKEVVLPSGRFASIRPITWFDRVVTYSASSNQELRVLLLACRVVTIDGEQLAMKQAEAMEIEEANPLIETVYADLLRASKSKGVA